MTKLKFDRARFDAGELPTRTRDGTKVLHVHDSGLAVGRPIVAWIEGLDAPCSYIASGEFFGSGLESVLDLVHEPKMRTLKIAVLRGAVRGGIYTTTSDQHDDFDWLVERVSKEDLLLRLLEVEVPE